MKRRFRITRTLIGLLLVCAAIIYFGLPYTALYWLRYGVRGVDVSHHQGKIDWVQLAKSDVAFVYIKATEGGTFQDKEFAANWKAAHDAGLAVGGYHFFTQCKSGEEQARNFLAQLPKDPDQLPPVLDAETLNPCSDGSTPVDAPQAIQAFLDKIETETGCRPIIYTDRDFEQAVIAGKFKTEKFWIRSLVLPPTFRTSAWTFWQVSDKVARPGITTPVDLDIFRGDAAEFARFRKATACFAKPS